ncbi:MAG: carbohydrate porin [Steroidobacteraceae bacterium]
MRTGTVHLDNLDATLAIDAERARGLPGVSAFAYLLYNNDASLSGDYVKDAMTVSNIDAPEAVRLYEAWLQWESSATHGFSLRFGWYDLNSEFDVNDSRALFINSNHGVGHELGQTGANGPSIFPVTSLAVRAAWSSAPSWRVLAAVFDGVPGDPDHPSSNRIQICGDEGAVGIVELQWAGERVTKLSLGHWRYSAEFEDIRSAQNEGFRPRNDNRGTYAAVEVALDGSRSADPATLGFVRYGVANDRINEFADSWGVGIRRRGVFAARPHDEFGIAYGRTRVSDAVRRFGALTGQLRDIDESGVELTYRAAITDWLTVQPDIQYIVNPSADRALDDSLAIGLRLEFSAAMRR